MIYFVVAEFLLTSASRGSSAIAEPLVGPPCIFTCKHVAFLVNRTFKHNNGNCFDDDNAKKIIKFACSCITTTVIIIVIISVYYISFSPDDVPDERCRSSRKCVHCSERGDRTAKYCPYSRRSDCGSPASAGAFNTSHCYNMSVSDALYEFTYTLHQCLEWYMRMK